MPFGWSQCRCLGFLLAGDISLAAAACCWQAQYATLGCRFKRAQEMIFAICPGCKMHPALHAAMDLCNEHAALRVEPNLPDGVEALSGSVRAHEDRRKRDSVSPHSLAVPLALDAWHCFTSIHCHSKNGHIAVTMGICSDCGHYGAH
eukprot:1143330-Pelagomonas_calceolata.AAC.2